MLSGSHARDQHHNPMGFQVTRARQCLFIQILSCSFSELQTTNLELLSSTANQCYGVHFCPIPGRDPRMLSSRRGVKCRKAMFTRPRVHPGARASQIRRQSSSKVLVEREHDTSLLCTRSSTFVTVRRAQQTSKTIPNLSGNSAVVVLVDLFHISTFVGGLHCCDGYGEDSGPPARRSRMRRKMVTRLVHFT